MLAPTTRPRADDSATALMLSPEALEKQRSGGTFSEIVERDGWVNDAPVIAWLLAVELIYLISLPLALFVFRPLSDRGILLARVLGLLAVCWLAWLVVSLGWMDFLAGRGLSGHGRGRRRVGRCPVVQVAGDVGLHQDEMAPAPARGGAVPGGLPGFRGGAVLQSRPVASLPGRRKADGAGLLQRRLSLDGTLPPYDPWFAGGYLNYYYWGYFVIACVNRVAAIVPATAFNLAVPLFFALTFTGAFSLGYNLAAGAKRAGFRRRDDDWAPLVGAQERKGNHKGRPYLPPVFCGMAAALFVAVIGNLDGIVQVIQGAWAVWAGGEAWPAFDFWRSSRMIPPLDSFEPPSLAFWLPDFIPGDAGASWHITEFPFFTFLFADLHAHMMVIPFTLLVLGLGLALVAGLRNGGAVWAAATGAALAVALGALWAINSWDYPSYVILTLGLIGLAALFTRNAPRNKLWLFAGLGASILAVSLLSFWPFHQFYETFNSGLDASRWRTPVDRFLGIHGLFLFIIVTFLIARTRSDLAALARSSANGEELPPGMGWLRLAVVVTVAAGVIFAVLGYWNAVLVSALLLLTLAAGWRVLQSPEPSRPYDAVALAMLVMAALIVIGVDFVTVEGDIGRMNTLFKYYLEVWVFMAIAAAYMLWRLAPAALHPLPLRGRARVGVKSLASRLLNIRGPAAVWLAVLALLVGSSFIYTALGTRDRLDDRFNDLPPTLDGMAYMTQAEHWERGETFPLWHDYQAIRWLQDNVEGSPVVLEAHMEQYRWGGRIANYTGLPTILGWPWHQIQQRHGYREQVDARAAHVTLAYETTDAETAVELMRNYGVSYVVVGELERLNYGEAGLAKFEKMAESGLLSKVYENEKTAIFRANFP